MDGKTLARIGAIVFVAFAIVAAVIDMNRPDDSPADFTMPGPAVIGRDPLDAELARCSGLGEAGPRDPSCLKAWAENRRRFLGQPATAPSAPSYTPASVPAPAMSGAR
ncbi:MAG: putative entry exclusion protein TrbK-alt [Defluviicoccus sp.]|nr:putative entry exclusion protein TrbK-alt [Defluviicoccus sp.]